MLPGKEKLVSFAELHTVFNTETKRMTFDKLYAGIRNRTDPVTWRTAIKDIAFLLDSPNSEWDLPRANRKDAENLLDVLVDSTFMEPLAPEMLYALGYDFSETERLPRINTLLVNGRHNPEPVIWELAERMSKKGITACINPVGHYADGQTRIIAPAKLLRGVDNLIILASTQSKYGGDLGTLMDTMCMLKNPEFAAKISTADIVIPMFGGSRGHKTGQAGRIGYEFLETEGDAEKLIDVTKRIKTILGENSPKIRFISVDIHNAKLPSEVFEREGSDFVSVCPTPEFAYAVGREIEEQGLGSYPIRIIAVDKGAMSRTKRFAENFLKTAGNGYNNVEVIEVAKQRGEGGEVKNAKIERIMEYFIDESGQVAINEAALDRVEHCEGYIRITVDDILDSGKSAKKDDEVLGRAYPGAVYKISVVTHPIMSNGVTYALDNTGANAVVVGNTVVPPGILSDPRVRVVDVSGAIERAL